jgi:hypothetical protein
MPLRSRAFSDLRFSPLERHPGTILGNEDRNSRSANECICVAGLRVGYKRTHHVPPDLRSAPAAPAPPPGEGRRVLSVVSGGGKSMDYRQEAREHLSALHLTLYEYVPPQSSPTTIFDVAVAAASGQQCRNAARLN